nr:amidase domain-containing protein [uncultured Niameybacter sp.]
MKLLKFKNKILLGVTLLVIGLVPLCAMETHEKEYLEDLPIEIGLPSLKEGSNSNEENEKPEPPPTLSEEELTAKFKILLEDIISKRNKYLLEGDVEGLKSLYNTDVKTGLYAFEHEEIKIKYLKNWADKQGVTFKSIDSTLHMRKVRDRGEGLYGMTCNVSTEFSYSYDDDPNTLTHFKLGTSHYIHLKEKENGYYIVKEWYTDPFADSLDITNEKSEEMKNFIVSHKPPSYVPDERTQKAIDYAHKYCGIGEDEYLFKYNKDYLNCNPRGGDCANFASQILYEGGKFKKTSTWNYTNDGTKAWVNAQALKNYLVNSGRGSLIAQGSYKEIYKTAYNLRPGDIVAYEKKGRITHVSTVTGLDSKGYPLVTCHNTDRLLVPYDLGWSNKSITFHLIDVHY